MAQNVGTIIGLKLHINIISGSETFGIELDQNLSKRSNFMGFFFFGKISKTIYWSIYEELS